MIIVLCENCFPTHGKYEVHTIVPIVACCQCGARDDRFNGGVECNAFSNDPRLERTAMKAYHMDDSTIYCADSPEEASEMYEHDTSEAVEPPYPTELTDAELDAPVPERGEDEELTGKMTSIRTWLNDPGTWPGFLCGSE